MVRMVLSLVDPTTASMWRCGAPDSVDAMKRVPTQTADAPSESAMASLEPNTAQPGREDES